MLSKNWGFYFNGSSTDWGSGDLAKFLSLVQQLEQYQNRDLESNTHVHILALALVLTRVIILHRCLNIAESEGMTFTCKYWMLLQVSFRTMGVEDLFAMLFTSIADEIHNHSVGITNMSVFVQERLSRLHQRLLDLTFNTPSQRFGYKILLVIDEAQNLGKTEYGKFLSQQMPSESERQGRDTSPDDCMWPMLSPLVHGFYQIAAVMSEICVIPCGTDLSILGMGCLEDSAPGPKGYSEMLRPFTDFQGWRSLEQVQDYRHLVRRSLSDDARIIFDTRVPETSMAELFERLRKRFRLIVSTIERMVMSSTDKIDWRLAIEEMEHILTSTDPRYCGKGNIVYDISRTISRMNQFKSQYAEYQNIRTVVQFFVLQHYLHGRPAILNTEEAPIVEASVGRSMVHTGETRRTVLDEPFALRAAVNFIRKDNPHFHNVICDLFSLSPKESVLGSSWEMAVMPRLIHVFHDKVLSDTALVPSNTVRCDKGLLDSKARIVSLNPHLPGTDYRSMSLNEFLEAHVENDSRSRKDGKQVPAFYHPAEMLSGPDIVFVLHLNNDGFCPVFIQLKLRASMDQLETTDQPDTMSAFTTVMDAAIQRHLGEARLETFCTSTRKSFLGVVVAYPDGLPIVEGLFPAHRSNKRKLAVLEEQIPRCITLRIDTNNIRSLFLETHMKALDLLKGGTWELGQGRWSGR